MQHLRTLIDKASEKCGGDKELAHKLGVYRPEISAWRNGRRHMSPETAVLLADLAQEDAVQAMTDAVIERNKGTRIGDKLREILGKALAAGVAVLWVFSYSGESRSATAQPMKSPTTLDSVYIVLSSLRARMRTALKSLRKIATRASGWGSCLPPSPGTANSPPPANTDNLTRYGW